MVWLVTASGLHWPRLVRQTTVHVPIEIKADQGSEVTRLRMTKQGHIGHSLWSS